MSRPHWDFNKKVVLAQLVRKHTGACSLEEFSKLNESDFEPALREMMKTYNGLQYSKMVRCFERLCRDKERDAIFREAFPEQVTLYASDLEKINQILLAEQEKGREREKECEKYRLIEMVNDTMNSMIDDIHLKFNGMEFNNSERVKNRIMELLDTIYESQINR